MNRSTLLRSAGAALLLAPFTSAFAQTWRTVDDHQALPGLSATATDIATDPTGTLLYSVGSVTPDVEGNRTALVRLSADQGATWADLDTYLAPGWHFAHFRGVGTGAGGRVFAAGHLWDSASGTYIWIVRESADGGATWLTADAFQQVSGGRSSCGDIKADPAGTVFAAGYGGSSAGTSWVVRKRLPGQPSFVTADAITSSLAGEARSVAFHPTAGVFVAGRVANVWTVRRSPDGVGWTTVDSFKDTAGYNSSAEAIAVDAGGTIYVAGRADQAVKVRKTTAISNNWVVRRSTNGGATWAVVERFGAVAENLVISAEAITLGNGGTVFVAGNTPDAWLVRKGVPGANGAMTWTTSDQFQRVAGQVARTWGITTGADGGIYAVGEGDDAFQVDSWITRKLMP